MKVKCIKSLYKRTYKKNAFTNGKKYEVDGKQVEDNIIFIIDSEYHSFNFATAQDNSTKEMYRFDEYFKYVK